MNNKKSIAVEKLIFVQLQIMSVGKVGNKNVQHTRCRQKRLNN